MINVKALLVDLDGTLVGTDEANYLAYSQALTEEGIYISRTKFDESAQGRHWSEFLPQLLKIVDSQSDPAKISRRKAEIYPSKLDRVILNTALINLIKVLRPQLRIGLVTTASATNTRAILNRFNLHPLFETVVTGDDVLRHKPDPQAYIVAAERFCVAANECIVVEDSEVGIASARAFGANVLRVQTL